MEINDADSQRIWSEVQKLRNDSQDEKMEQDEVMQDLKMLVEKFGSRVLDMAQAMAKVDDLQAGTESKFGKAAAEVKRSEGGAQ